MSKESSNSGQFSGMDISSIEEGLGMILSGSGEPAGSRGKTEKESTQPPEKKPGLAGTMIQIPETEEERKQFGGETVIKDEEENGEEGNGTEGKETQGQTRGEDAVITEDSPLFLHAATLQENGILPTLDLTSLKGKKQSEVIQAILDAQKKYVDEGRNEYLNSLSPRQKEYLDLIEKGIPEEEVEHQFKIEDAYGKITDEVLEQNEEVQTQLIVQDLRLKGVSDRKIDTLVKAVKEEGKLLDEAKDARDSIKTYIARQKEEKVKAAEKAQKEADDKEKELQTKIKSTIDTVAEILPGIPISANEKTKMYERMTKPVEFKVVDGQRVPVSMINKTRSEDRINFDLRLNYFIEMGMFKKDFDLSKLVKKVKSSAASRFAEAFKDDVLPTGGVSASGKKNNKAGAKETIIFPQI